MSLFSITAPIFVLIALGYAFRLFGFVQRHEIHRLNSFVYYVSLPAVILVSFWGVNWLNEETRAALVFNTGIIFASAFFLFCALSFIRMSGRIKAGIFIAALVGNTVYMGFPVAERALAAGTYDLFLAAATPHLALGIVLSILAIEWFALRSHNPLRYLEHVISNPLIIALVLGITLSVFRVEGVLADFFYEPLVLLAATASPLALVTLGAFLRGVFDWRCVRLALLAATIKLILLPVLVFSGGLVLGVSEKLLVASVLAAAMPTAVTSFVIAERYNVAPNLVASTLFVSTIFSLGTLLIVLFLLRAG